MDLPDYDNATEAATYLLADHTGQHRCRDGRYYTPRDFTDCPVQTAVATLTGVLTETRELAHVACHDAEHVDLVLYGMTGLVAGDLTAEDAEAWRLTTRNALEANAALLDPSVPRG